MHYDLGRVKTPFKSRYLWTNTLREKYITMTAFFVATWNGPELSSGLYTLVNTAYLKPLLHDQIFFDKFHMSNAFDRVNWEFSTNLPKIPH